VQTIACLEPPPTKPHACPVFSLCQTSALLVSYSRKSVLPFSDHLITISSGILRLRPRSSLNFFCRQVFFGKFSQKRERLVIGHRLRG
jgi:hypothetical protein